MGEKGRMRLQKRGARGPFSRGPHDGARLSGHRWAGSRASFSPIPGIVLWGGGEAPFQPAPHPPCPVPMCQPLQHARLAALRFSFLFFFCERVVAKETKASGSLAPTSHRRLAHSPLACRMLGGSLHRALPPPPRPAPPGNACLPLPAGLPQPAAEGLHQTDQEPVQARPAQQLPPRPPGLQERRP